MGRVISIIYKMTHLPTGKFYIGSLKDSSRFSTYVTSSKYVSKMMKENPEEWKREIVEEFENVEFTTVVVEEQAIIEKCVKKLGWEAIWNKFYHSGVSECYSEETIRKRNAIIRSPEKRALAAEKTRQQMSRPGASDAVARSNAERVHSEETRRRLSESHKNIPHTEESKAKIAEAQRGRKRMIDLEENDRRIKPEEVEQRLSEGWKLAVSAP